MGAAGITCFITVWQLLQQQHHISTCKTNTAMGRTLTGESFIDGGGASLLRCVILRVCYD
jgi:hypothetical protein